MICQGICERMKRGNASSAHGHDMGTLWRTLATYGATLCQNDDFSLPYHATNPSATPPHLLFGTYSKRAQSIYSELVQFCRNEVFPAEKQWERELQEHTRLNQRWNHVIPVVEKLKIKAKARGLWNLFLPNSEYGANLTNLEYAPSCMWWASIAGCPRRWNASASPARC